MYRRILTPVDGSEISMRGLEEAIRIAGALNATVRIIYVVGDVRLISGEYPGLYVNELVNAMQEGGQKILDDAVAFARQRGCTPESELMQADGDSAAERIVDQARSWSADLIVMGTHGRRGVRRLALGSDAEMVIRNSPVPVLLVKGANHAG